jgi:hypothetical protein
VNLDAIVKPPIEALSGRFFLVSYLPTYADALFVLVLFWAGAPGDGLSFKAAWTTAKGLGVAELILIVVAITLVAVLAQPLQLAMTRVVEGGWPDALGAGLARDRQRRRRDRLREAATLPADPAKHTPDTVQKCGVAGAALRARFPLPDHVIRATALGNALAAAEDCAGRAYGIDVVVAWPRLYPLLGDKVRAIVDDRRDKLDIAVRAAVTMAVTGVVAIALLWPAGWWLLLALIPFVLAVVAYAGAVRAALAYGESLHSAVDLHRFDLLKAMHVALPEDADAEYELNRRLADFWRQGVPMREPYRHPGS